MLLLLILEIFIRLLGFMLAPLSIEFPFDVVTPIFTFLNYMVDGIRLLTFFVFDASLLRSVFGFILAFNAIGLTYDFIWRIISYIKLSRDG